MNRIDQKFKELKRKRKKAFIAFITAGDPNLATTEKLVLAFEEAGVDIVELGVPFSDPIADGPTIQASSQRSLEKGTTLFQVFDLVKKIRGKTEIPIVLMMYYNPIFHLGEKRFVQKCIENGVDGVIVPDLPPEEAQTLIKLFKQNGLVNIFMAAPTTTKERMKKIVAASTGFVYYVSITGVTGVKKSLPTVYVNHINSIKRLTKKPVCVGFGITTPRQVKQISKFADGVIVGSAIVREVARHTGKKDLVKQVSRFVKRLRNG